MINFAFKLTYLRKTIKPNKYKKTAVFWIKQWTYSIRQSKGHVFIELI